MLKIKIAKISLKSKNIIIFKEIIEFKIQEYLSLKII